MSPLKGGSGVALIAALALSCGPSLAAESTTDDVGNEILPHKMPVSEFIFDGALALDMMQTANIATKRDAKGAWTCEEKNPALGPHPSVGRIVGYAVLAAGLHAAITWELVSNDVPAPLIRGWEYVTIGVETSYIVHNYSIGLRARF